MQHARQPVPIEQFGRDALAILDDLNIEKAHWCGLSMGGMVGQWLGANAPERFGKIILSNTACHYPDPTNWHNRIKAVQDGGIAAAVADTVIAGWLTSDFREREPQITASLKAMLLATPMQGYLACCRTCHTRPARAAAANQEPDAPSPGAGHLDADRGRRIHPKPNSGRQLDDPRRRAYFQHRAAARLHRRRGHFDAALSSAVSIAATAAPCFETLASLAPQHEGHGFFSSSTFILEEACRLARRLEGWAANTVCNSGKLLGQRQILSSIRGCRSDSSGDVAL